MTKFKINEARRKTLERCVFEINPEFSQRIGGYELVSGVKVLVDGEYRDEAIWAGDFYSAGPAAFKFLDEGGELWKNSLLAIASKQYQNGKLPCGVSTRLKYRTLSPFIESYGLWWVLTAGEYLEKTGDIEFEKVFKGVTGRVIKYFSRMADRDGLIVMNWPNIDWNWTIVRPRKSALANALWYGVLKLAAIDGLEKIKLAFNNYFWNKEEGAYADRRAVFLDANSMAISFGLADDDKIGETLKTLQKVEGDFGPMSYLGSPTAVSNWHKDQVCPFAAYLYMKALLKVGDKSRAKMIFETVMASALKVTHGFNTDTLPEFWKKDGKLGGGPAIPFVKNKVFAVSLCHVWATFGDYEPEK